MIYKVNDFKKKHLDHYLQNKDSQLLTHFLNFFSKLVFFLVFHVMIEQKERMKY